MISFALILAWTISSPDISDFFEIPEWCPTAVPSAMTFGSEDNYVECWSNDVYTSSWRVFRYGEDVTEHLDAQPTWDADRQQWNVQSALDSRKHTEHVEYEGEEAEIDLDPDSNADPEYVGTARKNTYLEWFASRQFYNIDTWDYEWIPDVRYTAYSEGLVTNRTLLGYTPKASRLTPQWLAATYAPFAAFCERSYYFSEGQSSSWSAGIWGPAEPLTEFSFATNRYADLTPFQPDTNRTVRSRRLVEYDNLRRLSNTIGYLYPFDSLILNRPGWQGFGTILFGSSVIEKAYPEYKELPEFDWMEEPCDALSSNEWRHVAVTFDDFPEGGDFRFYGGWWRIPRIAFDGVNFSEPPFWDWNSMVEKGLSEDKAVAEDYPISCMMTNFFKIDSTPVPWRDGTTRRLDMNDMARIDLILAAMDVTYNRAEPFYWGKSELGDAHASAGFRLNTITFDNLHWVRDIDAGFHSTIDEDKSLYLDALTGESYTNVITEGVATYPYVAVTPSSSTYDFSTYVPYGDTAWVYADDFEAGLSILTQGLTNGNHKAYIYPSWAGGTTFGIIAGVVGVGIEYPVVHADAHLDESVTVETTLDVSRSYAWARSRAYDFEDRHGVFHPGRKGWNMSDVNLWSLTSFMSKAGNDSTEVWYADDVYDQELTRSTMYKAELDLVTNLASTTNKMSAKIRALQEKMEAEMKLMISSYDDPKTVIPIKKTDVSDMCSHAKYTVDDTVISAYGIPGSSIIYMAHGDPVITNMTREADYSIETHDVKIEVATNSVVIATTNFMTAVTNDYKMAETNYVEVTVRTNGHSVVETGEVIVDEDHKINVKVTYNDEELWSTNDVTHASTTNDLGTVFVKSTNYVTVVTNDVWISITPGEDDSSATTNVSMRITTDECTISVWTNGYSVTTNYTVMTRTDNAKVETFTTNVEYSVTNYVSGAYSILEAIVNVQDGGVSSLKFVLPDGTEIEPGGEMILGTMGYSITPPVEDPDHPATWDEEHGAMCYGKFNFWTKVKWNWNALRLNLD